MLKPSGRNCEKATITYKQLCERCQKKTNSPNLVNVSGGVIYHLPFVTLFLWVLYFAECVELCPTRLRFNSQFL